jgi:hypothetical protein
MSATTFTAGPRRRSAFGALTRTELRLMVRERSRCCGASAFRRWS